MRSSVILNAVALAGLLCPTAATMGQQPAEDGDGLFDKAAKLIAEARQIDDYLAKKAKLSAAQAALEKHLAKRLGEYDAARTQVQIANVQLVLGESEAQRAASAAARDASLEKARARYTLAFNRLSEAGLEVIDPDTNRVSLIVDEDTHRRAMNALRRQQDCEAIAEGIAQMEAGEGKPAEQAFEDTRTRLNFTQEA